MRSGLVCLLFATTVWGQGAKSPSRIAQDEMASASSVPATKPAEVKDFPADMPVITIDGVCESAKPAKTAGNGCKTVLTRAQFEALVGLVQPNLRKDWRRRFAANYADTLIRASKAQQMGLDKGPRFDQLMILQRRAALSQILAQTQEETASQISDKDIEDYYKQNSSDFEELELERVYVPLSQAGGNANETFAEAKKRAQDAIDAMKKVADDLRARAVAGEDFEQLQADAYRRAMYNTTSPTKIEMEKRRRNRLSAQERSLWELKVGEISPVIDGPAGHYIYKVGEKGLLPLDEVRAQIFSKLRNQKLQQYKEEIQQFATSTLNEDYFALPTNSPSAGEP